MNSEFRAPQSCKLLVITRGVHRKQFAAILLEAKPAGMPALQVALNESSAASNGGLIYSLADPEALDNTRKTEGIRIRLPVCFFAVGDFYKPSRKSDQEGGVPCVSG
jgi:hypothetical protein